MTHSYALSVLSSLVDARRSAFVSKPCGDKHPTCRPQPRAASAPVTSPRGDVTDRSQWRGTMWAATEASGGARSGDERD